MQKSKKGFILNSFFLSVLLHLLLLLSIIIILIKKPDENKKPPHLYVPSYVYTKSASSFNPSKSNSHSPRSTPTNKNNHAQKDTFMNSQKTFINKKETDIKAKIVARQDRQQLKKTKITKTRRAPQSMLEASFATLKAEQMKSIRQTRENEPILLVGDINQVADPIIKLMAQSLSAHFRYPETEGMLGIKGKVIIELVLHPQGYFTNVLMLKSSQNQNLDAAALYAVNTAPLVAGANRFLSKPTRFVVGFVFN